MISHQHINSVWKLLFHPQALKWNCSRETKHIRSTFSPLVCMPLASHLPITALGEFKMNALFFEVCKCKFLKPHFWHKAFPFAVIYTRSGFPLWCSWMAFVPAREFSTQITIMLSQLCACFSSTLGKTMKYGWRCLGFLLTKESLFPWLSRIPLWTWKEEI